MSSHDVTVLGFALVLAAGLALQALAARGRAGVPRLGQVLSAIMRSRTGRVGVLVAWAWLGLHFFAR